jgi:hypothetical protein
VIDHALRVWASVNQVSEEDEVCLCRGARSMILLDFSEKLKQKVQSTMHIADRIGAPSFGSPRQAARAPSFQETS